MQEEQQEADEGEETGPTSRLGYLWVEFTTERGERGLDAAARPTTASALLAAGAAEEQGTEGEDAPPDLRWLHADDLHLTLAFFGKESPSRLSAVLEVLARIPFSGAEITLGPLRALPKPQRATALGVANELQGKILIDVTVPLMPPRVSLVQLPEGGSAVAALQAELGEGVRVVSAFQNISAHHLKDRDHDD